MAAHTDQCTRGETAKEREDRTYVARLDDEDAAEGTLFVQDTGSPKGRGLFASQPIAVNALVCEYRGELITRQEAEKREVRYEEEHRGCYMFYFRLHGRGTWPGAPPNPDNAWCVDATMFQCRSRFINHNRRAPNLRARMLTPRGDRPRIALFATREIRADEELRFDYGDHCPESIAANPWLEE